jgi:hypothetical protein
MGEQAIGEVINIDGHELVNVAKPLFFGYVFLSGLVMFRIPQYSGTMLNIAMLSAVSFVSAALSESAEGDWKSLLDLIAVISLLFSILFGTYMAASLALWIPV